MNSSMGLTEMTMNVDVRDLEVVLAMYEREVTAIEREYRQQRSRLDIIIDDLRQRIARAPKDATTVSIEVEGRPYAEMRLIDAAAHFLSNAQRAVEARGIATALVQGGFEPKGDPENFYKSVYNQLKAESDKPGGKIKQLEDKRFRVATEVDSLPEPGPGSRPGIALPSTADNAIAPAVVPSGFSGVGGYR